MSTVTHDIVAKLWNLCNILKDDGVTYHQYVTELTYLLFLKMAAETGTQDQIPAGHRWADLEARYQAARAHVARLTPALLAKAFHGELVPQDPDDEPAGELLARIKAQAAGSQPRRAPRGRVGRALARP